MKIGVAFFGSQKFCLQDCEYMFGKIFANLATFWERKNLTGNLIMDVSNHHPPPFFGNANIFSASYNSNNSITFLQSTWVIFSAVELSQKFAIESSEKISNSDMLVNRLNSHEIRSA